MESTYIYELGKAQEPLWATRRKPRVEPELKQYVTPTSDGSEASQLTSNRLIQGHLPSKDPPYLNVTAYVHEWSHPAPDEKGFINQDAPASTLGATMGPIPGQRQRITQYEENRTGKKGTL